MLLRSKWKPRKFNRNAQDYTARKSQLISQEPEFADFESFEALMPFY